MTTEITLADRFSVFLNFEIILKYLYFFFFKLRHPHQARTSFRWMPLIIMVSKEVKYLQGLQEVLNYQSEILQKPTGGSPNTTRGPFMLLQFSGVFLLRSTESQNYGLQICKNAQILVFCQGVKNFILILSCITCKGNFLVFSIFTRLFIFVHSLRAFNKNLGVTL